MTSKQLMVISVVRLGLTMQLVMMVTNPLRIPWLHMGIDKKVELLQDNHFG